VTTPYTVVVTDVDHGCIDSAKLTLIVLEPGMLVMPSAFTPNGDQHNDTYFPVTSGPQVVIHYFRIYDRWGQLLHDSPTQSWDGSFKGQQQPGGVYLYFIDAEVPDTQHPGQQKSITQEGTLTLLR
jgi:gliding motility-associated-like protein